MLTILLMEVHALYSYDFAEEEEEKKNSGSRFWRGIAVA
jgi:hypothetical protein